jgi:dihydrofolate reductase
MGTFQAIAAMSENRVIGSNNQIPWHLPEDFKFFKSTTMGHVLLMGRKTFESIGRPLPGRTTIVLSRSGFTHDGVQSIASLDELTPPGDVTVFVCGGADVYRQLLPRCSDLYLTHVKKTVEGDAFFPPYEDLFEPVETLQDNDAFRIVHYRRRLPERPESE